MPGREKGRSKIPIKHMGGKRRETQMVIRPQNQIRRKEVKGKKSLIFMLGKGGESRPIGGCEGGLSAKSTQKKKENQKGQRVEEFKQGEE